MITTSLHHIYGAYIYDTPERLHVLAISIPVMIITYIFDRYFRNKTFPYKIVPTILYSIVILIPSLILIGIFEGIYNHVVKNILFFANVPESVIRQDFYGSYEQELLEAPNDFIFELTGVAQGVLAVLLAIQLHRFIFMTFRA